jgi:hypothetical protein
LVGAGLQLSRGIGLSNFGQGGDESQPSVLGRTSKVSPREGKLNQVMEGIKEGFVSSRPEMIYQLLGRDLISVFGLEELRKGWVPVDQVEIVREPRVINDWAEAVIRLSVENGQQYYRVVFHWENGAWKIFATEGLK